MAYNMVNAGLVLLSTFELLFDNECISIFISE